MQGGISKNSLHYFYEINRSAAVNNNDVKARFKLTALPIIISHDVLWNSFTM